MFGRGIKLFNWIGFEIRLDWSWSITAILVTCTLALGAFPAFYPGLSTLTYWFMGFIGAMGLFLSVLLHELGHAVIARRSGIPIRGITLFIFGGVAEMEKEPPTPKAEFCIAIAGPIVTAVIMVLCRTLSMIGENQNWPVTFTAVLDYLAAINRMILLFNLVPAFPLDGGRVLRAALWAWRRQFTSATRIASLFGTGFGWILVGLGVFQIITGAWLGGFWGILLGLFLRHLSIMSYEDCLFREELEGEPVRRFMYPNPETVSACTTVAEFSSRFPFEGLSRLFPVVEEGKVVGAVTLRQIDQVPMAERSERCVTDVMTPITEDNTIAPDTNLFEALGLMTRTQNNRLIVKERDHLAGILSLKDLQGFLTMKVKA